MQYPENIWHIYIFLLLFTDLCYDFSYACITTPYFSNDGARKPYSVSPKKNTRAAAIIASAPAA